MNLDHFKLIEWTEYYSVECFWTRLDDEQAQVCITHKKNDAKKIPLDKVAKKLHSCPKIFFLAQDFFF